MRCHRRARSSTPKRTPAAARGQGRQQRWSLHLWTAHTQQLWPAEGKAGGRAHLPGASRPFGAPRGPGGTAALSVLRVAGMGSGSRGQRRHRGAAVRVKAGTRADGAAHV
eukprot:1155809-Pelagomonas_calceolata.AAC.2